MINLSKEVLKVWFNNIDKNRKKLIKIAKDKRNKIIGDSKKIKNIKEKIDNQSNFGFEKDFTEMADKEKTTIEKLKQREKNQIEAGIELKIKTELLKIKSYMKESLIKEMNEKIQNERKQKAILEDKKIKEKEIMREITLKKRLEEQQKKTKAEEKRLKDIQEMHEKTQNEQI